MTTIGIIGRRAYGEMDHYVSNFHDNLTACHHWQPSNDPLRSTLGKAEHVSD